MFARQEVKHMKLMQKKLYFCIYLLTAKDSRGMGGAGSQAKGGGREEDQRSRGAEATAGHNHLNKCDGNSHLSF